MREEEFINSLKDHADGFKVTPSAGLFDKIIISGNLNNKAEEQDFANLLKEKAADFSVDPSVGLFDKISAANKMGAGVEEFNTIVKNKARHFSVSPSSGLFEKIVVTRNHLLARRYATYGIVAILLLSVSSFFYWLSHSTDALKKDNETVYYSDAKNSENVPTKMPELNPQESVTEKAVQPSKQGNSYASVSVNINIKSVEIQSSNAISLPIGKAKERISSHANAGSQAKQIKLFINSDYSDHSNLISNNLANSNIPETVNSTDNSLGRSTFSESNNNNAKTVETPNQQNPIEGNEALVSRNESKPEMKENSTVSSVNPPLPAAIKSRKKIVGTKWAIGVYGTPQLLKSEYHSNKTNENWANEYLKTKVQNDKSNFNYQAGLLLERKLSNSFSLVSGLGLSQIKFRELRIVTYLTPSEVSGNDFTISNKEYIRKSSYDVTMNYLEVPLHIQYTKHWNKFSLSAQAGMAYNLLMDANAAVYSSDTVNTCIVQGANKTLQQHVFYFSSAVTAEYFPSKHISIFSGPTYRTALNSVYDDKYVLSQKPYFYGLTMGVKYAF